MDFVELINSLGFPIAIVIGGGVLGYKILIKVLEIFREHMSEMRDIIRCHDKTMNNTIESNNMIKDVLKELLEFLRS